MSALLTPEQMLATARERVAEGTTPEHLIKVAKVWREKWAALVEKQEAGVQLDGRASIYTGETYREARDRWEAYRLLLVEHLVQAGDPS